ncbi:MAG: FliH/SctL family protein [Deltaproteobacteria bacterium]
MSRIIKNDDAVLSQPIVIESLVLQTFEPEVEVSEPTEEVDVVTPQEPDQPSQLELERQELEQLKIESQKVIDETETMVLDLLQKARDEARAIIANAQEQADLIRSQSETEAAELKASNQKQGYEEGLKKAEEDIEADRLAAFQQSQELLEEARQLKIQMMRSSEADMMRLVIAIAKKVIASELTTNPYFIVNVLREAIDFLDHPDNITVYVNPQDLERILTITKSDSFFDIGNSDVNLDFRADNRVSPGGCSLESQGGSVDTRLETRISGVEQALREVSGDE